MTPSVDTLQSVGLLEQRHLNCVSGETYIDVCPGWLSRSSRRSVAATTATSARRRRYRAVRGWCTAWWSGVASPLSGRCAHSRRPISVPGPPLRFASRDTVEVERPLLLAITAEAPMPASIATIRVASICKEPCYVRVVRRRGRGHSGSSAQGGRKSWSFPL